MTKNIYWETHIQSKNWQHNFRASQSSWNLSRKDKKLHFHWRCSNSMYVRPVDPSAPINDVLLAILKKNNRANEIYSIAGREKSILYRPPFTTTVCYFIFQLSLKFLWWPPSLPSEYQSIINHFFLTNISYCYWRSIWAYVFRDRSKRARIKKKFLVVLRNKETKEILSSFHFQTFLSSSSSIIFYNR
jgi:hypothetical protein